MIAPAYMRTVGLALTVSLAACGSHHSKYARQSIAPGELVWRYADDRLQVTRNGELVSESGRWERLAPAVSCVPAARDWATEATSSHRSGTVMEWSGLLGGLAAAAGGITIVATSDLDNEAHVLTGFGIAIGGLVTGLIVAGVGTRRQRSAAARGIDAINLYNDQLAGGAKCP